MRFNLCARRSNQSKIWGESHPRQSSPSSCTELVPWDLLKLLSKNVRLLFRWIDFIRVATCQGISSVINDVAPFPEIVSACAEFPRCCCLLHSGEIRWGDGRCHHHCLRIGRHNMGWVCGRRKQGGTLYANRPDHQWSIELVEEFEWSGEGAAGWFTALSWGLGQQLYRFLQLWYYVSTNIYIQMPVCPLPAVEPATHEFSKLSCSCSRLPG